MIIEEQQVKVVTDVLSISVVMSTLLGYLPPIAALFTIIWTGIQIYDWYKRTRKEDDDLK